MKTEITHKLIGIAALILTASFISTAVQAATVTIDSLTYETNENGTASVTDCPDYFTGAVTIPSSITVDGTAYTVTSIGYGAFEDCTALTEIIIPDSVTSIGSYAFSSCDSLTEIQVSENNSSYQSIEGILFSKDGTLLHTYPAGKPDTSYIIPDSVTSIGNSAFSDCTSLTEIIIPDSVTSIGWNAFYCCTSLTEIVIPDSVTSIGDSAFAYCYSLTHVTLGNGVTSIGDSAFAYCYSLTEIIIPDSVTSIGSYAFDDCRSLTEIQVSENNSSYQSIEGILFSKDGTLLHTYPKGKPDTSYIIPDSVTSIGYGAFRYCNSLTEIIISDSVTEIAEYAFHNCDSLTNAVIGNGVTTIGNSAFRSCDSLTHVTLGNGVTSIGNSAFYWCDSLTHVTLGNGVTSIGDSAFAYCDSLTEVIIPDSVTSIGNYAFYFCGLLTEIIIPDSVTSIGINVFYHCDSLTNIILGNGVTSIGDSAFFHCSSLTGIYFQSQTPPEVGSYVFYKCPENMIIYYPLGVEVNWPTEWQGFATEAWDPNGIPSLPENVTIDPLTFTLIAGTETYTVSACDPNYTGELIIPSSISIGSAPEDPSEVTPAESLTYPVVSIEPDAFAGCSLITRIIIPETVASIGNAVFSGCTELEEVYFSSSEPPAMEIGTLFEGCSEELVIYYPENTENNWTPALEGTTIPSRTWDPAVGPAPEQPTLTCGTVSKNPETGEISFTLTFTGTLQESADGITWSDVSDAVKGTYTVTVQKNQNRFFRAAVK